MAYFPLFINLENVPVLIVGGGTTALRKAEKLSYFKPRLHVIALSYKINHQHVQRIKRIEEVLPKFRLDKPAFPVV